MSSIEWDASLETGDEVVDLQHRTIHDLFNNLESATDNGSELLKTLEYLTEHVVVHFATEESLMERAGFPGELTAAHVAEHRKLTDGVRERVLEFRTGQLSSTGPLIAFLREWLVSHVHECDRLLVDHVRATGAHAELPDEWLTIKASSAA